MGYYTNYEVSWDNTKTTIAQQKLIVENFNNVLENEDNFYPHLVTVEDNFFAIKAKWYDMEIDMMDISTQIPNIEFEENYVSYLYEPCKISKSEVLIIPEDKVIFNKKRRELRINKSYLQSGEYQTQKDKLLEKFI